MSTRTRLAVTIAALLYAVLVGFALLVKTVDGARIVSQHASAEDTLVRARAETLSVQIRAVFEAGRPVTTQAQNGDPEATPFVRGVVDASGSFAWLLDRGGRTIYASASVIGLSDSAITKLDSVVVDMGIVRRISRLAGVEPGMAVARDRTVLAGGRVVSIDVGYDRPIKLFAVQLGLPQSVNRVVVGRFPNDPPRSHLDLVGPLVVAIPIVVLLAAVLGGLLTRLVLAPTELSINQLINEVEAVTDGRSLHRRIATETGASSDALDRLTTTLNEMIGRLEHSFAALRRFTADASHELKTPLAVLRADVERALANDSNRAEQLVALEEALAETTRMSDLVESLLTLARADEGRFELDREPVDLQALARDVFETATLLAEPKGIAVEMAPPPALSVRGDAARLRQLFLNLITNAIKYTSANGEVELSLARTDGSVHFSVRDTGMGIAAADLSHVFDRFWRADHARSRVGERSGFGLGLAISQYIAHAHGGSLTVHSRLGRGSTFTVALPLEPASTVMTEK